MCFASTLPFQCRTSLDTLEAELKNFKTRASTVAKGIKSSGDETIASQFEKFITSVLDDIEVLELKVSAVEVSTNLSVLLRQRCAAVTAMAI